MRPFSSWRLTHHANKTCVSSVSWIFVIQTQNNEAVDSVGRIEIDHAKVEERRIFLKEAKSGNTFSITYQEAYPNSGDEYLVRQTKNRETCRAAG